MHGARAAYQRAIDFGDDNAAEVSLKLDELLEDEATRPSSGEPSV